MVNDYRITKYEEEFDGISEKKRLVRDQIKKDKPRVKDFHTYISDNDGLYKKPFMNAYNGKCAYCGLSIDIIPKSYFEIDHFIYQKSSKFATKKDAGYIENLVLACHNCNHKKSGYIVADDDYDKLYPDTAEIKTTFSRDEDFYIRYNTPCNDSIVQFYEQLGLGDELKRVDYLLMSILGLEKKLYDAGLNEAYVKIDSMYKLLLRKRNENDV